MPFLSSGGSDMSILTDIVASAKSLLGLFAEFPLNVFVGCGIGIAIFGVIKKARKTA